MFSAVEWDPEKARKNQLKHRVSFEEAAEALFDALNNEEISGPCKVKGELRWEGQGFGESRPLKVIFTLRGETARIISARRL